MFYIAQIFNDERIFSALEDILFVALTIWYTCGQTFVGGEKIKGK